MKKNSHLSKKNIDNILPLTQTQTGILFHYLYNRTSNVYYEQYEYELCESLDKEIMINAIHGVVQNDAVLKSVFAWKGLSNPVHIILKNTIVPVEWIEFAYRDINDEFEAFYRIPIDIDVNPIWFRFYSTSEHKYYMVIKFHHIFLDGWSNAILMHRIFSSYDMLKTGSQIVCENTYIDEYQALIKQIIENETKEKDKNTEYWENKLEGCPWFTSTQYMDYIPSCESNCTVVKNLNTYELSFINQYIRENEITLSILTSAAWSLLLQEMYQIDDVVFGNIINGRTGKVSAIHHLIGMFAHVVPTRVSFAKIKDVRSLFDYLKRDFVEIQTYQDISLMSIKKITKSTYPIQSLIIIENYPIASMNQDNIQIRSINVREHTNYLFALFVNETICKDIRLQYDSKLINEELALMILDSYYNILKRLIQKKL